MRDESALKSKLVAALREQLPQAIALRHEDVRTAGIPDLSITGVGKTTWWEAKHGDPDFDSTGIQELTMSRLAHAGYARYIIWQESPDGDFKRTLIVHPKNLATLQAEASCVGYDMRFVVDFIRKAHRV